MPRQVGGTMPRKGIRLPTAMIDEVDKLVKEHPELYNSRQQFIESAIRNKILEIKTIHMETRE